MVRFGDDIVITARSRQQVELIIQIMTEFLAERGANPKPDKSYVVSITDVDGNHPVSKASSKRDPSFIYEVGKMVEVLDFDLDRWNDNSTGIHHYITRAEAVAHQ